MRAVARYSGLHQIEGRLSLRRRGEMGMRGKWEVGRMLCAEDNAVSGEDMKMLEDKRVTRADLSQLYIRLF